MEVSSSLYKILIYHTRQRIESWGWPELIAEIYATKGGTPLRSTSYRVGQLLDEQSYQVLAAQVETAMDNQWKM